MAININQWSPDTCGCTIEYSWDDSVSAELRTHSATRIVKACLAHDGLKNDTANHYDKVRNENVRKNKAHGQLLALSQIGDVVLQPNGETYFQLKNGITINYSFTGTGADRVLSVSVVGYNLSTTQKNTLTAWCETNLGVGKVIIN